MTRQTAATLVTVALLAAVLFVALCAWLGAAGLFLAVALSVAGVYGIWQAVR